MLGDQRYVLLQGNAEELIPQLPDQYINCIITSPPYWQMRDYAVDEEGEIGNEQSPDEYVDKIVGIFHLLKSKLTNSGSVWLNLGDKYHNKNLMGMPWRVALKMQEDGWLLRNDVIWDHCKGIHSITDRLKNSYEHIFHFVKKKNYYYDADVIRIKPKVKPKIEDNRISSPTGISGKKYRKMILESMSLTDEEKESAMNGLEKVIGDVRAGIVNDFRMIIRGRQKVTHSGNEKLTRRSKQLEKYGFYILKSLEKGSLPTDIWQVALSHQSCHNAHYAVFPESLLTVPIKSTTKINDVVLDPFSGTGTTVLAAMRLGRRGIGFDLSQQYTEYAKQRLQKITIGE